MLPTTHNRSLGRHGNVTIARGREIVDRGSLFVAQAAWPVASAEAAAAAIATMRQDGCCASADHNMTAYRVMDAKGKVTKEYDDDGEARGGQRLLGCLTQLKATNVAVIVSRVWGGQNLGKARFDHICTAARELLAAVGHQPGTNRASCSAEQVSRRSSHARSALCRVGRGRWSSPCRARCSDSP